MNTDISRFQLETFALLLPGLIIAMALHELAHGYAAYRLGDPTAKLLGRLSFNPIRHLDPLGTAMFAFTFFFTSFMFGWAKPVPVDLRNFKNPKRDMALVAVAGPLTNFAIALVLTAVLVHAAPSGELAFEVIYRALLVNVVLGIFNLIPLPPLDGSRIIGAFMDDHTYRRWLNLDQYAMVTFLLLFFVLSGPVTTLMVNGQQHVIDAMVTVVGG